MWGHSTDGNPFTHEYELPATKYVVSKTLKDADAWQNSILLRGDAVDTVTALKGPVGQGSVDHRQRVADAEASTPLPDPTATRYSICPLTLGTGARLFDGPAPMTELDASPAAS